MDTHMKTIRKQSKRERVSAVLKKKQVDRLPCQVSYTGRMGDRCAGYFNLEPADLPDFFNNHILRLDFSRPPGEETKEQQDQAVTRDLWGVGFDSSEEGYRVKDYPLRDKDMTRHTWPDPENPDFFKGIPELILEERTGRDRFVLPNLGFALFERAWSLTGLEDFLMMMYADPKQSEALLEKITEIQTAFCRKWVEAGVDGGYFGDDLGAQRGLLFSPDLWRKVFKPRYKRMFDVFTGAGLPVIMHSDGDIREILPDLVDIGLSSINPCQPEVLEHRWLKKEYGKDLAFFGGLSTQQVLPHGSSEDVIEEGKRCIRILGGDGTGLIYGPSHRIMSDIPLENVAAFIETCAFLKRDHG